MAQLKTGDERPYQYSRPLGQLDPRVLLADRSFNRHSINDGHHMSPFDNGMIQVGLDNLEVRLVQGIDEDKFRGTLSRAQRATIGIGLDDESAEEDWEEMLKGGLQTALESQVIVFEVYSVARATTHQLVRSRRAAFHQQSMRASFMGEMPEVRIPESVWRDPGARSAFFAAVKACHHAYRVACEADISYQDARYILPIGTTTYIMCEYSVREFLALYAYRACSMFQWEIVHTVRQMGALLALAHPWLAPYIKISCQDGPCLDCGGGGRVFQTGYWAHCVACGGSGKVGSRCTFQGWENVEEGCNFPWAKTELRTYKPEAHKIGGK
jgi:thymidylate synthase ThyX